MAATRQVSKATPRGYSDYRKMLAERDLDLVIVSTPDHWHALPMIEAVEAGADVYVEKPTSVDVVESQAMLAAARRHGRVVQVGTQRRSTPHLIEAQRRHRPRGQARPDRPGRDLLLLRHPPGQPEAGGAARDARLGLLERAGAAPALQRRRPPARLALVHGLRQRHGGRPVHPHVRHGALDARARHAEAHQQRRRAHHRPGRRLRHQRHADGDLRLRRPAGDLEPPRLGRAARQALSVGGDAPRRQGQPEGGRHGLRVPAERGPARLPRGALRARGVPRGQDGEGAREARGAGAACAHEEPAGVPRDARPARRRHRGRLHLERRLHPRQPLAAPRPDPRVGPRQGRRS